MKVYRVEDRHGGGPYRGNRYYTLNSMSNAHDADVSRAHPGPANDGIAWQHVENIFGYVCGFASMEQLHAWFDGWLDLLDENGFVVSTYEVPFPKVLHGGHQVMFHRKLATRIASTSPLEGVAA